MKNVHVIQYLLGGSLVCLTALPVCSQDMTRPELNVGDRWVYERTDRTKNVADGTREDKVVAKSDTEYRFEFKSSQTGNVTSFVQDLNVNSIEVNGKKRTPFVPFFSWPLTPGKKWTGQYSGPNQAGTGTYAEERSCEVGGKESIQTKAGPYEAMKISCKGNFRMPDNRGQTTLNGYTESVYWYAPAAKRTVRVEYKDGTFGFGAWNNYVDELAAIELK